MARGAATFTVEWLPVGNNNLPELGNIITNAMVAKTQWLEIPMPALSVIQIATKVMSTLQKATKVDPSRFEVT